ncbi:MAG: hypothetical protein ABI605_07375 [Rhizobacter sp.]
MPASDCGAGEVVFALIRRLSCSPPDNDSMLCVPPVIGRLALLFGLVSLCACSPTLDWREVRPEGSGLVALFPCKPSTDARVVTLEGASVRMLLTACRAGDATWALAFADVANPSRVAPVLAALRAATAANLGATVQALGPMRVSGMTPNPRAERLSVRGKLPAGDPVTMETAFFTKGTRVFQASVMGPQLKAEAVDSFFDNLKLPP